MGYEETGAKNEDTVEGDVKWVYIAGIYLE